MERKLNHINLENYTHFVLIAFLALTLLLAGCQPQPTPTESPAEPPPPTEVPPTQAPPEEPVAAQAPPELVGVEWVLIAYGDAGNPVVVEPDTRPTIAFGADGNASGSGGCNSFTTAFQVEGETISFGPAAATAMACEIGMDRETAYLAALEKAQSYQVVGYDRLLINYDTGAGYPEALVFDAQTPLVGTLWVLSDYGDPEDPTPSQPGVVTTAIFAPDGALNGSAGCNSYNAAYTIQDGRISISQPTSTMMACETGMEQEQAYLTALETAESYRLAGSYLEITYANGAARLRYSAQHMSLENVRWVLSAIDGQPLPASVNAYVIFTPGQEGQENQVNGNGGCNGFFGAYTLEGDKLTIPGPFGATQMMCPEEVMQVEQGLMSGLENAQSYSIILKGLTITTSSGGLAFYADRAPLEGSLWKLASLGPIDNPQPPVAEANFTASFTRQQGMPSGVMAGSTGCNDYASAYYANLSEIKVNLPVKSENACSPALAEQEQAYFLGLNSARSYRILGNEMQIIYGDQALNFVVVPPPSDEDAGGPLSPLNGTRWWLASIDTFIAIPGSETTAQFAIDPGGQTGQISGSGGCNDYSAQITGVFTVGPASATQSICDNPTGIMDQENAYLAALSNAQGFSLEGDSLLITTSQGVLVFTNKGPSAVQPLPPTETPEAVQPLPPTDTPEAVQPLPTPVAVINAPDTGQAGQAITFDGSGSTASSDIASYMWDFGDGDTGEGASVEHAFAQPGFYTVTLTVIDADGQTGSATLELTIN
jgi:heat shock protein HslJ